MCKHACQLRLRGESSVGLRRSVDLMRAHARRALRNLVRSSYGRLCACSVINHTQTVTHAAVWESHIVCDVMCVTWRRHFPSSDMRERVLSHIIHTTRIYAVHYIDDERETRHRTYQDRTHQFPQSYQAVVNRAQLRDRHANDIKRITAKSQNMCVHKLWAFFVLLHSPPIIRHITS